MLKMSKLAVVCVGVLFSLIAGCGQATAKPANKKLQVFILAGQSNMVGHASYLTVPTLLKLDDPDAKAATQRVFKNGEIAPEDVKAHIETRVKLNALTKELADNKIVGAEKIAAGILDLGQEL